MRNDELKDVILEKLLLHPRLTRQEFLELHPCRPASMLHAINELKSAEIVIEPDRTGAKTGRRSPALAINPAFGAFVGLELQPQRLLGVLLDGAGNLLRRAALEFPAGITAQAIPGKLEHILAELRDAAPEWRTLWRGIGFADPGLVDVVRQRSLRAHNVPGWTAAPVNGWLEELSGLKQIFIAPAPMFRALAEYNARRPEVPRSLVLMELDTGIGGAFVQNGRLLVGDSSRGMELGHLVIRPGGPLCKCGNHGCLEAIAGELGIRRKIGDMIAGKVATELRVNSTLDDFIAFVKRRDRAAGLLAGEICDAIASAVTVVVTLLNPGAVIFSGRLSHLEDMLLDTVRRTLNVNCFYGAIEHLQLEVSKLDEFAAAAGAALATRRRVLLPDDPLWF